MSNLLRVWLVVDYPDLNSDTGKRTRTPERVYKLFIVKMMFLFSTNFLNKYYYCDSRGRLRFGHCFPESVPRLWGRVGRRRDEPGVGSDPDPAHRSKT